MTSYSRTIDFATTASIDMMSLNNKVVNMRQVVKRSKVQVVNKLCKNITALKKKKGTEEQKAQNLRKAERFIEEIDSIKHLKEDKVSKYALANTLSFKDVCKASLSAGPRALARLADHPLMQKVVGDFRTQHPDWKDLAAYLLVKQTGRRFKTKKQKQRKKLSLSVANINASETMTKAYIQERFGEEGLKKAEQRFQKKRKLLPPSDNSNLPDAASHSRDEAESKKKKEEAGSRHMDITEENIDKSDEDSKDLEDTSNEEMSGNDSTDSNNDKTKDNEAITGKVKVCKNSQSAANVEKVKVSTNKSSNSIALDMNTKSEMEENNEQLPSNQSMKKSLKSANLKSASHENSYNSSSDESMGKQDSQKGTKQSMSSKKSECVVKEFNIDKTDNILSDGENSLETSNEEQEEDENSNLDSDASAQEVPRLSNRLKKKSKSKIPSILTNNPQKPVSDPFFAGSDDEGEEEGTFNDFDDALSRDLDEDENAMGGGQTKSMFYNPQGDIYRKGVRVPAHSWSRQVRGGKWQRQERGKDREKRGRSYHGSQRGRGRPFGELVRGDRSKPREESFSREGDDNKLRFGSREKPRNEQFAGTSKSVTASTEKLHPSWEASKKRKAEQSGIQAFKGSKITFDDDD